MSKRKEKPDTVKDELHHEYGIVRNSFYILGKIRKYRKSLLAVMLFGALASAVMNFLWSVIGKYVIDLVERQAKSPGQSVKPLLALLGITALVELAARTVSTVCDSKMWPAFIYVRMKVIQERIAKALSMNYETLEDPKMLDRKQKAEEATGGNDEGVEGMMHSIYSLLQRVFIIAATAALMSTLSMGLVLVIVVFGLLQYLSFSHYVKLDKKETWDKLAPYWRKEYYLSQTTQDFSYAKDIRLFGMKGWLMDRFSGVLDFKYRRMVASRNFWLRNSIFSCVFMLLQNIIVYGSLICSVLYKDVTIGNFTLYIGAAASLSSALNGLLNDMGMYRRRSMEVDDFRSFMDIKEEEEDTIPIPRSDKYTFVFDRVSFKYPGQENYAIKDLSLTLEAGKRLAVVGLNGAGKTTFIKLLLRLYDVTEGAILLNGTDIRRFERKEYYSLFAPVFQNVEIFAFPMAENVSMKAPADTDCDEAERRLREAGMGDKLDSLSHGVHTELLKVIHDDGVDLSGGEKQKLALARALYKNSPVVVLDEPTAALDALAEYKLYKDFDKITEGRTAVYISHRLSSTRFCDSIAMFKDGGIIEYGTHEELLKKGGAYAEMFEVQAQYYKDGNGAEPEVAENV